MAVDAATAELEALRPTLLRIARLHLRNDAWAEDAVSEALLAALESRSRFEGRSRLQTWVVGILRHKIIDCLRVRKREVSLTDDDGDDLEDALFKADGHYRDEPVAWSRPDSDLERTQLLTILETCIQSLPPVQARLFMLREWMELSTAEICNELSITPTNAGVLLHRARMRLRECLEIRWFGSRP